MKTNETAEENRTGFGALSTRRAPPIHYTNDVDGATDAVATASGPFGSFRRYRTPMEALREDHPLWVGSSLGKKNATAARRDNDMLAGLGYETTSALPHLCVDTRERESLGWTEHVTANGGYLRMSDQPQS